jgi:hypothetical protein
MGLERVTEIYKTKQDKLTLLAALESSLLIPNRRGLCFCRPNGVRLAIIQLQILNRDKFAGDNLGEIR